MGKWCIRNTHYHCKGNCPRFNIKLNEILKRGHDINLLNEMKLYI